MDRPESFVADFWLLAQSEDWIMKDCTTWLWDELLSHLESGRYTPEEITEALQEILEALCDTPQEVQA